MATIGSQILRSNSDSNSSDSSLSAGVSRVGSWTERAKGRTVVQPVEHSIDINDTRVMSQPAHNALTTYVPAAQPALDDTAPATKRTATQRAAAQATACFKVLPECGAEFFGSPITVTTLSAMCPAQAIAFGVSWPNALAANIINTQPAWVQNAELPSVTYLAGKSLYELQRAAHIYGIDLQAPNGLPATPGLITDLWGIRHAGNLLGHVNHWLTPAAKGWARVVSAPATCSALNVGLVALTVGASVKLHKSGNLDTFFSDLNAIPQPFATSISTVITYMLKELAVVIDAIEARLRANAKQLDTVLPEPSAASYRWDERLGTDLLRLTGNPLNTIGTALACIGVSIPVMLNGFESYNGFANLGEATWQGPDFLAGMVRAQQLSRRCERLAEALNLQLPADNLPHRLWSGQGATSQPLLGLNATAAQLRAVMGSPLFAEAALAGVVGVGLGGGLTLNQSDWLAIYNTSQQLVTTPVLDATLSALKRLNAHVYLLLAELDAQELRLGNPAAQKKQQESSDNSSDPSV